MSREGDGWMRQEMPEISAWLDSLRQTFGREAIDQQIRRGMRGECGFYVCENGHEFGKPGSPGTPLSEIPKVVDTKGKR